MMKTPLSRKLKEHFLPYLLDAAKLTLKMGENDNSFEMFLFIVSETDEGLQTKVLDFNVLHEKVGLPRSVFNQNPLEFFSGVIDSMKSFENVIFCSYANKADYALYHKEDDKEITDALSEMTEEEAKDFFKHDPFRRTNRILFTFETSKGFEMEAYAISKDEDTEEYNLTKDEDYNPNSYNEEEKPGFNVPLLFLYEKKDQSIFD